MLVATSSKGITPLRRLHLIRPSGLPSPQGEGYSLVPTQAADTRATLGAQGNSPPGLGTDEGRGELGIAQLNLSGASALTQVSFRARRSQTGQSWEFPGATRRQLFAYFVWKKYDPFLVGTSMEGSPLSLPDGSQPPSAKGSQERGRHELGTPRTRGAGAQPLLLCKRRNALYVGSLDQSFTGASLPRRSIAERISIKSE